MVGVDATLIGFGLRGMGLALAGGAGVSSGSGCSEGFLAASLDAGTVSPNLLAAGFPRMSAVSAAAISLAVMISGSGSSGGAGETGSLPRPVVALVLAV